MFFRLHGENSEQAVEPPDILKYIVKAEDKIHKDIIQGDALCCPTANIISCLMNLFRGVPALAANTLPGSQMRQPGRKVPMGYCQTGCIALSYLQKRADGKRLSGRLS